MKVAWGSIRIFHKHWATEEAVEEISLCGKTVLPEVCQMSELQQRTKSNIQDLLGYWEYPSDSAVCHAGLYTEEEIWWPRCVVQSHLQDNVKSKWIVIVIWG